MKRCENCGVEFNGHENTMCPECIRQSDARLERDAMESVPVDVKRIADALDRMAERPAPPELIAPVVLYAQMEPVTEPDPAAVIYAPAAFEWAKDEAARTVKIYHEKKIRFAATAILDALREQGLLHQVDGQGQSYGDCEPSDPDHAIAVEVVAHVLRTIA